MATIRLPYPHTGQRIVRSQARRFNWLAAGRRWRKTTMVMAIAVESALEGQTVIWGAPVFDQVRIGWDETKHAVGTVAAFNQSQMTARFPSGGKIVYRSLDNPDNVRGHTADGVVVDESADVAKFAWYEVLRPMLIDTNGWAWLIGTPKGHNWYWTEHMKAKSADDAISWQAPTLGARVDEQTHTLVREPHPLENPFIPFDEVVNLYNDMPQDTFRQEVLGIFMENSGAVFRNIDACLTAPLGATPKDHEGHEFVMGVDWGKQNDFTVLSVGCVDCRREVALDRFNKIGWSIQRERLKALYDLWQPYVILAEANSIGGPNIEALVEEDIPVQPFDMTGMSKTPLIKAMVRALERNEYAWLPDAIGKSEFEAYEQKQTPSGNTQFSAPEGLHDDVVVSRCLTLRASNMWGSLA